MLISSGRGLEKLCDWDERVKRILKKEATLFTDYSSI